ncbi:hypothetical protein yc1106_03414 [Curvularia clavata]|uniref:Uncharacterized protein n=1 Tax=Curvularia clavata TaxID=95742 RepID=A0A9Q8Z5P3_CURCL|nr:hypothetical protein yc1106_03414 [Curvularia clavata]
MSVGDELRKIIASYGAGPQLDALPSAESMTWISYSAGNPPHALLIGNHYGREIYAYLARYGEKAREVRYCTKDPEKLGARSSSPPAIVTQDEVMKMSLDAPFRYLAENSKPMKRKFSMLIRWYFLTRGLIDGLECERDDFCKRFGAAVKRIEEEKLYEQDGTQNRTRRTRDVVEESSDVEDADTVYGLRSGSRNGKTEASTNRKIELQSPSVRLSREPQNSNTNTDFDFLLAYLKEYDALYLLDNLPEADEMQFVTQKSIPEAQPKKLFVGKEAKSGHDIYAYMVGLPRGFHEVRFYVQTADNEEPMKTETVARQQVWHPFSKCYPKQPSALEQSDRARVTLMVKFYFIAAGIATDCVLKETKKYPERLRVALEYIADRMGPAAAKPPSHDAKNGIARSEAIAKPVMSSESSYIDESDIQSTLAAEPPRGSPWPRNFARKSAPSLVQNNQEPNATSSPQPNSKKDTIADTPTPDDAPSAPPRGVKRSAEDVEFEDLARIIMKEQTLTKEINALQHDMDVLEERKRIWLEKWQKEFDELQGRMSRTTEERTNVRKQFKKQRLSSGGDE